MTHSHRTASCRLSMPFAVCRLACACAALLAAGPAIAAEADDPSAITALNKLATSLKHDDDGFVIEVNFRGAQIDDAALAHLAGLARIKSVLLNDTAISDDGLKTIGQLTTLANLDLRGCKVSNDGMAHLVGLDKLRALRLSGQSGATTVDDDGMQSIGKLTALVALPLDFLWVSEEGLAKLDGLKNLEEIYLARTLVGDDAMKELQRFPKLKRLRISQTSVTGAGLEHLAPIKTLVDLDLSENSQLDDAGLAPLADMKQLTKLNLWRVAMTDEGAAHLAGLTRLEWLNLDNTQLTDAGLPYLAGMAKLSFLHLGSTSVSDDGLP
ncbi:MAG: hypothetical protein KDA42_03620, partial [Planctomycetales bacterium]|nr:hypothetical protein [Planctomycetales bacterium]